MAGRSFGALLILVAAILAGSCASSNGSAVTADEACVRYAQAQCKHMEACTPLLLDVSYGDVGTCVERNKLSCLFGMNTTGTSQTPERRETCANAVSGLSCEEWLHEYTDKTTEACGTKPGALPNGQACGLNAQCSSTYCKISGSRCGTCVPRVHADGACADLSECDLNLACQDGRCVVPPRLGEACDSSRFIDCKGYGREILCKAPSSFGPGVCVTPLGKGAPCEPGSDACDRYQLGLSCDAATMTCQPFFTVAATGETCGFVNNMTVECRGDGICTSTGTSSTCQPPIPDGARCDPLGTITSECRWPADCVGGICQVPDPTICR